MGVLHNKIASDRPVCLQVHFEGPFERGEKELLADTIEEIEKALTIAEQRMENLRWWSCCCEVVSGERLFFASSSSIPEVFSARSVGWLALLMRAQAPPPQ